MFFEVPDDIDNEFSLVAKIKKTHCPSLGDFGIHFLITCYDKTIAHSARMNAVSKSSRVIS